MFAADMNAVTRFVSTVGWMMVLGFSMPRAIMVSRTAAKILMNAVESIVSCVYWWHDTSCNGQTKLTYK